MGGTCSTHCANMLGRRSRTQISANSWTKGSRWLSNRKRRKQKRKTVGSQGRFKSASTLRNHNLTSTRSSRRKKRETSSLRLSWKTTGEGTRIPRIIATQICWSNIGPQWPTNLKGRPKPLMSTFRNLWRPFASTSIRWRASTAIRSIKLLRSGAK